jgi:hypothetical protein
MTILNLNGPAGRSPRGKNSSRAWMGIGLVIAVLGIGSTFASSITINSDNNTEFGQGVQKTVYCGGDNVSLLVSPISAYKNNSPASNATPGTFPLSAIKVNNVPAACDGVNFVISMYDGSEGSSAKTLATKSGTSMITPTVYWRSTFLNNTDNYVVKGKSASSARSDSSTCQTAPNSVQTADKFTATSTGYGALLSLSRTNYVSPCLVGYLSVGAGTISGTGMFQINLKSDADTYLDSSVAARIVIETQEDVVGINSTTSVKRKVGGASETGTLGLAYDSAS